MFRWSAAESSAPRPSFRMRRRTPLSSCAQNDVGGRSASRRLAGRGSAGVRDRVRPGLRRRRKASLFEGRTARQGWRDWGLAKPGMLRHGWHEQLVRMQVARSAKQTKSTAFRGARASVCEAQLRAQTERHRAVLGGRTNGSTGCRDWGQSKPEASRHGWHEQHVSPPWMYSQRPLNPGQPDGDGSKP